MVFNTIVWSRVFGWNTFLLVYWRLTPIYFHVHFEVKRAYFILLRSILRYLYFCPGGCGIYVKEGGTFSDIACHYDLGCRIIFTLFLIFGPILSFPSLISAALAPCPLPVSRPFVISFVFGSIRTYKYYK